MKPTPVSKTHSLETWQVGNKLPHVVFIIVLQNGHGDWELFSRYYSMHRCYFSGFSEKFYIIGREEEYLINYIQDLQLMDPEHPFLEKIRVTEGKLLYDSNELFVEPGQCAGG